MQPVKLSATIYQGATFKLALDRVTYPYPVTLDSKGVLRKDDGTEAPETDRIEENYVGSSARAQIRKTIDDPAIIHEMTTENGGIVLGGKRLTLVIEDDDTTAMNGWENAVCDVEVVRGDGTVERQYEISLRLDKEVTR